MRSVFSIMILFFLSGCIDKNKIPDGVLNQQQMRLVMWDMMRADEFVINFVIKDTAKDRKTESSKLYEQIFTIHNTSRQEFKKSLAFYQSRPDLLKTVTDSLRIDEKKGMENQYENLSKPVLDTTGKKTIRDGKAIL